MRSSKASRGLGPNLLPRLVSVAAAFVCCGCALNGDFDRVRPELRTDWMHDWVGRDAVASIGLPPSAFPLTDDELLLRDYAFALIDPPYDRNRWDSVFREYGFGRRPTDPILFDITTYTRRLADVYRRSEASAYAQITTDARNDVLRMDLFFNVAGRVADMDRKRIKAMARVSFTTVPEQANAVFRNNENTAIVDWVCVSLHARADAYRFAVERLAVWVPSPRAADVDRALSLLQGRIAQFCTAPASSGAVVAKD
jgi:hypothetical protein